ncbi:hypothetical protein ACFLTH_15330 [Bacteroidota bacterium]
MANQAVAIAFAETTKGDSPEWNQPGYIYGTTTTSAVLSSTANSLSSYFFGYTSGNTTVPRNHFSGKKIICGMNVVVAYADVAAYLLLQGSHDNSTWFTVDSLSTDTTPNVTGVKSYLADLTDIYCPYYRLLFNSNLVSCGTSGTSTFFYAVPAPDGVGQVGTVTVK